MKYLQNKYVHIGLFAVMMILVTVRCFNRIPFTDKNKANTYDAQMWTSASITSYHMYFKNYVRPTTELDNWFPTYAWKKGVNVFTGDSAMINYYTNVIQYKPDTIKFPYDQITITGKKQQYSLAVKYDTTSFPRKDFQWFDRATWTFGWKAPNFGKYVMGWWIQTFATTKPNPKGYFEFLVPSDIADSGSTKYVPSQKPSPAPYSYAPIEYENLARQPNAIMTILTIAAVVITGWLFFNFWIGFLAGAWLSLNKTFIDVNCAVGLDSFAVGLSAIAFMLMLLTIKSILNNDKWWKIILWGAGTGIISSLALSSKLNAGMVIITEALVFGIISIITVFKGIKIKSQPPLVRFTPLLKTLIAGLLTGVLSFLIFVKLNPQVQKQPFERMDAISGSIDDYFDRRARIFTSNQITDRLKAANQEIINLSKTPGTNQQALMNVYNQLNIIGKNYNEESQRYALKENEFHLTKSAKYIKDVERLEKEVQKLNPNFEPKTAFINWVQVKHSWPSAFELVAKRIAVVDPENPDRYYGTFGSLLKVKYNFLDALFAILGLAFGCLLTWKQWKEKKQFFTYGILLLSFALMLIGNVDFVWQDWPRYMTPIFPLYAIIISLGIFETGRFIKDKVAAKKMKPAASHQPKK
jgi:hypothetical protein